MSGNLIRRYSGSLLLACCALFILRELSRYLSPPCTLHSNTLLTAQVHEVMVKVRTSNDTDTAVRWLPNLQDSLTESHIFSRHRLKIWYGGRCFDADPANKLLVVGHCDTDKDQTFSLTAANMLLHQRSNKCVVKRNSSNELALGQCTDTALKFVVKDDMFLQSTVNNKVLCASPTSKMDTTRPNLYSCLGAPVALTPCDNSSSRVELTPDNEFLEERKHFVGVKAPAGGSCDFKACGLNKNAEPVEMLRPLYSSRCSRVYDCVTVVTKTARRPYLVMRLAQSFRDIKGYDLRIISYDDGPNDYPPEVWEALAEYPDIKYIVGDDDDMGISRGRNLALDMVKTKYFLLVDDDHVCNNKTDLEKMVEILDTTDATLVGGKFEGFMKFAGAVRFGHYHERQEFAVFSGHCRQPLPKFPNCEQCDSTSNIFLARTQIIRQIKGWSEELKIAEHADFFVKLKAYGLKVVYCDDIEVINQQESPQERSMNYQKLRYDQGRKNRMFRLMNSRYNVNGLFWCSEHDVLEDGTLKCLKTKHKIGYC